MPRRRSGNAASRTSLAPAGDAAVTVAHNVSGQAVRVVAVDAAGKVHTADHTMAGSAGKVFQTEYTFGRLPLAQVKRFRFQVRPYEWVEFKGIAVQPRPQAKPSNRHELKAQGRPARAAGDAEAQPAATDAIAVRGTVVDARTGAPVPQFRTVLAPSDGRRPLHWQQHTIARHEAGRYERRIERRRSDQPIDLGELLVAAK